MAALQVVLQVVLQQLVAALALQLLLIIHFLFLQLLAVMRRWTLCR